MDFWYRQRPVCRNYWWNAIGIPLRMGETLLLFKTFVSQSHIATGIDRMGLGIKKDFYDYHGPATGQNAVWLATVHLMIGLLQRDSAALLRASQTIGNEVLLTTAEGIQHDYSFHQHGPQLYAGGYGLGFARDVAKFVYVFSGTRYRFSETQTAVITSYVLDGLQWMTYRGTVDYSTTGREIARRQERNRTQTLTDLCLQLAALPLPRQKELQAMALRLQGGEVAFTGNRHFWRSDFMTHHTNGFYTSIKMASSRLAATESGNSENLKGWYLGQGVQFVMRHGTEYKEIFPVWDWRRLPGHLCQQSAATPPLFTWGRGGEEKTEYAGGVSNGRYGLAAQRYEWEEVRARRSWFCFDDEVVCLGAGITCNTGNPLLQSVNQCLQSGAVFTSGKGVGAKPVALKSGEATTGPVRWAVHDSVGYFFTGAASVTVQAKAQKGSWREINAQPAYSDSVLQNPVFSAWINLGTRTKNASYRYTIVPGISAPDAARYQSRVAVIRNDSAVQAVRHTALGITMAAFYNPGELRISSALGISVNKPVLVLWKEAEESMELSLSSPENKEGRVDVSIRGKISCAGCVWTQKEKATRFSVTLPSGTDAGKTVTMILKKGGYIDRL